jgi:iron complex transport system substrate-binding protein
MNNKKSLYAIVFACLIALFAYTGYQVTQNKPTIPVVQQTEQKTIQIKHEQGVTEVKVNPQRIVVLDYGILDTLDTLGVEPEMLATAKQYTPKYLSKYTGDNVKDVGHLKEPTLETIAELKPDLIIMSGRQRPYYDKLAAIAPTINLSVANVGYLDALHQQMTILGQIFQKEEKAEQEFQNLKAEIEKTRDMAQASGKKSLLLLTVGNKLNAYGPGMRYGFLYDSTSLNLPTVMEKHEAVGVKSPGGKVISYEYIKDRDPDYILVLDRNAATNMGGTSAKDMIDVDILKSTKAYKNNKIIYITPDLWYLANNGYRSTLLMLDEVKEALK